MLMTKQTAELKSSDNIRDTGAEIKYITLLVVVVCVATGSRCIR